MRTTLRLDRNRHRARGAIFRYRWSGLWVLEFVDSLNEQKNTERDDDKIDRDTDEISVGENRSQFLRVHQ